MVFPAPVPEIPVANVDEAVGYYVGCLGFTSDWGGSAGGIAGISRGDCRLFLTSKAFREGYGNQSPALFWLNLGSREEVDELFAEWSQRGALIPSPPEDKPWLLREFTVSDHDGNLIRVFFDFHAAVNITGDAKQSKTPAP